MKDPKRKIGDLHASRRHNFSKAIFCVCLFATGLKKARAEGKRCHAQEFFMFYYESRKRELKTKLLMSRSGDFVSFFLFVFFLNNELVAR
jgi:hypothetical protein